MEYYVGYDIGTTNLKCLLLAENGTIEKVIKESTPKIQYKSHLFFDLKKIESFVDNTLESLSSFYNVKSVGFSSVGETIIPIKEHKSICNPPLWDEKEITSTKEEREIIESLAPSQAIGTLTKPLFSIHKILWMKREIEGVKDADLFLPLSSYFVYRKTGLPFWDYSQASRSGAFDIRTKKWIEPLLDYFSIVLPSPILPMGHDGGKCDNIYYGIGGHDHIVGFYGIEKSLQEENKSLYYSSMGTSEVLATLVDENKIGNFVPSAKGYLQPSFFPKKYTATRSFRSFGSMLESIRTITSYNDDYAKMNEDISNLASTEPACLFSSNGDFIQASDNTDWLNIYKIKRGCKREEIVESAYLYLSVLSEIMRCDLENQYNLNKDGIFVVGGGITKNKTFLSYLSSAITQPVLLLNTEEISALGAALVGQNVVSSHSIKIKHIEVEKNIKFERLIKETVKCYKELV